MKLIGTIRDRELDLDLEKPGLKVRVRRTARAVLLDDKGRLGILYARNGNFYMLPGGKIEAGESYEAAVRREVIEETGWESRIGGEIGYTVEYYAKLPGAENDGMKAFSYCYEARAVEFVGISLSEDEAGDGVELMWVDDAETAIELFRNAKVRATERTSEGLMRVIEERDRIILERYLEMKK